MIILLRLLLFIFILVLSYWLFLDDDIIVKK